MTNKSLFTSTRTRTKGATATTRNAAGGRAFNSSAKQALAQITATNCFNGTYYVDAQANLEVAKQAALEVAKEDPEFVAKCAVYGRKKSYMKDMPAFLAVVLHEHDKTLFRRVFPTVIDNGKQLRNFINMARSGAVTGKKANMSSGSIRHAIRDWFASKPSWVLFKASIGQDPSMRDILRMARPRPDSDEKAALFAYMKGAEFDEKEGVYRVWKRKNPNDKNSQMYVAHQHSFESLPSIVQDYERFKASGGQGEVPKVDFRLVAHMLSDEQWKEIARNAPWQMTQMNLNTFQRHGVFNDSELCEMIANRLRDPQAIEKARVFPYKLFQAYKETEGVPFEVRDALQDAVDVALNNVPKINGKVVVAVDTSGSMGCSVTGYRRGSTSKVRCVDQAALFASALFRQNREAKLMPFDTRVHKCDLNPRDSVFTNADKLSRFGGGGTDCSSVLRELNARRDKVDVVIFLSDYESWVDSGYSWGYGRSTGMLTEWEQLKRHNPNAVLVCIDLTPRANSQVTERPGILQVGGFSDQVFDVVANFVEAGTESKNYWIDQIEKVEL